MQKTKNVKMKRDDGFSVEIGNAKHLSNMEETQYFFCKEGIFQLQMADNIDPERINPDLKHNVIQISSYSTSNIFVSRIFIQFDKMLKTNFLDARLNQNKIKYLMFECLKRLLYCQSSYNELVKQINFKIENFNQEEYLKSSVIKNQPFLEDLDEKVRSLIICQAGHFYRDTINIFKEFFSNRLSNNKKREIGDKRLDNLITWCIHQFGEEDKLTEFLKSHHNEWIKKFVTIRNKLEHPSVNEFIEILNFRILPSGDIHVPCWKLVHKDYPHEESSDLLYDIKAYIENLFRFYENLILFCIEKNIMHDGIANLCKIFRIPDNEIDNDLPILFTLEIDPTEFQKRVQKANKI